MFVFFRLRNYLLLFTGCMASFFHVATVCAEVKEYFNPELLESDSNSDIDASLSAIENGNQLPGVYHVDVFINNELFGTKDIEFKINDMEGSNTEKLMPCLSYDFLEGASINMRLFTGVTPEDKCVNIMSIPQSSSKFDFSSQRLSLSFPQSVMIQNARGFVPVELWDEGINAFIINYNFSGSRTEAKEKKEIFSNNYLNFRPGLNIGPWRQRNYLTYYQNSTGKKEWNRVYSYLQRDLQSFRSQIVFGDSTSKSDVFDSVPFRGVQLYSDNDMLPDSLKGYAPVVRGIAKTNALVKVKQNGYIIYQTYVSPGSFVLSDLYPTGGSGDLHVTIKETDGSEQFLLIPYASLPVLQRQGQLRYNIVSGTYRSYDTNVSSTKFSQLSLSYGLPWGNTLYGGTQISQPYKSFSYGIGQNLGVIGAISIDLTNASSKLKYQNKTNGNTYRIRYSKNFLSTGTNLTIAGYKYSTNGYNTLQEVMSSYTREHNSYSVAYTKEKAEVTLNQNLDSAGALTLSFMRENLLNDKGFSETMGLGYSNSWLGMSYSINFSRNKNHYNSSVNGYKHYNDNNLFALNVSFPLDFSKQQSFINYTLNSGSDGKVQNTIGVNGSLLEGNNLNWNIQKGFSNDRLNDSSNLNLSYRATYGELNAGYGFSNSSQTFNYGVSGGMLLHRNGLTLSQQSGETLALVKIPGASGVGLMNQIGVKTDFRGYTVIPYLTPYQKNQVSLNANNLPYNIDITNSAHVIVPTRGAIVLTEFEANLGERALVNLRIKNRDTNVPFGTVVKYHNSSNISSSSIVGDNGQVYLAGVSKTGTLTAQWGKLPTERCSANYDLSNLKPEGNIFIIESDCE